MRYLFFIIALLCAAWGQAGEKDTVIAVVIPVQAQAEKLKLNTNTLKLIYLRKQLYWPTGKRIAPVNLQSEHALRGLFSQAVLGSLPKQQIDYWNGMYFNGIQPPYTVNSEEAALRYIEQTHNAIGYVSACSVDARVQAVLWIEHSEVLANAPEKLNCDRP